jgi:serine/threonine protein kinase
MAILKTSECFPLSPEEPIFTIVVFKQNDQIYTARLNGRCTSKTDISPENLTDTVKLDISAFQPLYSNKYTRAQPTGQHFVKRPNLLSYYPCNQTSKTRIAEEVLQEVHICEILRLQPHSNIAEYIGCEVNDGKISGICFKQYRESLQQKLNPRHLNKRAFARSACLNEDWCSCVIEGIKNGLKHLHSLGLVHNDITPSNIMLDERDTAIIIDFGSCRRIRENLQGVGRTYEWYDDGVQVASPSNDLDALAEMRAWMFGQEDEFKFVEMTLR